MNIFEWGVSQEPGHSNFCIHNNKHRTVRLSTTSHRGDWRSFADESEVTGPPEEFELTLNGDLEWPRPALGASLKEDKRLYSYVHIYVLCL